MAKCIEVKEILPPKSGLGTYGKKQGNKGHDYMHILKKKKGEVHFF